MTPLMLDFNRNKVPHSYISSKITYESRLRNRIKVVEWHATINTV